MQTIYKQYLDEARKKAPKLASNAVSNVTLPQGNPAGQGAANTSAANVSPQGAIQNGANAALNQFYASTGANTGAVATNNGASGSPQSAMQGKANSALNQFYASAPGPNAPTSTLGGRTADGKYRLGDGSTYDTLQEAINANAGANDYVISEENGETLYDGKPLYNGTGVLAAKGDGGKFRSFMGSESEIYDAAGNRVLPTELGEDAPRGGHTLHGLFKSSNGYIYDYDTATDEELMNHGYYRAPDGSVRIAEDQDQILYRLKNGLDPSQAASQMVQNQLRSGTLNVPGTGPVDVSPYYPQSGGKQGGSGGSKPSGQSWQDVEIPQNPGYDYTYKDSNGVTHYVKEPRAYPGTPRSTPSGSQPQTQPQKTPEQAYLDQYDYGQAPEWTGTDYETRRDAALAAAQNMRWDGSEYQDLRDQLLADAMRPYEGSPYDEKRNAAIEAAAEKWQGSEYQPRRDAALQRAENMQWNYDPNADPVWQALQKQYRREGDRATKNALGQAASMTGGVPSSYAVTAASQAGDYYAAQLSDRLPQVYQDAYNRYLQEFQRQMGISDQYQGFDDREYSRWADQQGKNLDLADRYNQYGQQDYGQYMDRVNQQLSGADRMNGYDQTEYQRYLDQYGQELDAADRLNNYGATEYDRYRDRLGQWNTDRNFTYGLNRDAVSDARYADETAYERAWNEENRDYSRNYQARRDAILDNRADREWAQELTEYADAQGWKRAEWEQYLREYGDQLSEKEREWAYQMSRDAENDRRYNQEYEYQRTRDAENDRRYNDQTAYERAVYDEDRAYQRQQDEQDRKYQQDVFNYNAEQDALDRQYQQDVFNYNRDQDAYQKYLDEYEMGQQETESGNREYDDAIAFLRTYGVVGGRYADILGVPPGTTWDDYWKQYGYDPSAQSDNGGYSGGGYTGGGYTGGGDEPQTQTEPITDPEGNNDLYEFSNERHANGNKMTKGFRSTLASLKKDQAEGKSALELQAKIRQLMLDYTITNYEGGLILYELGLAGQTPEPKKKSDEPKMIPFGPSMEA